MLVDKLLKEIRVFIVYVADAEAAEAARMFDVLMGREVAPRKDWIVDRAAFLDREALDI